MKPLQSRPAFAWIRTATGFACLQGGIFLAAAFFAWQRSDAFHRRATLPATNNQPRVVRPLYDYDFVISDGQLAEVLRKLHPKFQSHPAKINFVDHALRMWGADAVFTDDSLSGRQMLSLLLNHDAFQKQYDANLPLLQRSPQGIAVTTQAGRASVSHVDHLMGTLAEVGIPLTQSIHTASGSATVGDIYTNALSTFRLNQREYEWTTLAAAFYGRDGEGWVSGEGQSLNFDLLAERLIRQPQPQGVCYGQHRIYTLVMLIRIDDQVRAESSPESVAKRLLSDETRSNIHHYLLGMTQRLYHTQSEEGYWDGNWPDLQQKIPDPDNSPISRRILATGHVLEWWAMAPEELHPPRDTIVRAAQWLAREIIVMDPETVEKNFTFLTHAGRALALWRGSLPFEFERQNRNANLQVTQQL